MPSLSTGRIRRFLFRDDARQIVLKYPQTALVNIQRSLGLGRRPANSFEVLDQLHLRRDDPPSLRNVADRHFTAALRHITTLTLGFLPAQFPKRASPYFKRSSREETHRRAANNIRCLLI